MVKPFRSFFLSFTIVAILLFSAMRTTNVYADDGDGTDTDTTATQTTDPSGGDESSETTTEENTPSTDADQGQSEETAPSSDEGAAEEQSLGEVMGQVPDNTTVTVLNSEGEALPLASQESADLIQSDYDPIWCPEGTPPVPGTDGCTQSFSSFTDLLTYLQANETDTVYQQAGTIYIQKDQYLGGESEINFNNYNFNEINKHNLTLQGGWNTADNTVNSADTTQFSVPITIGSGTNPWIGSLTLNNISISGVSSQAGLSLYSQSDITLTQVEVTNSQTGANLDAGGDVTINNSKFDKNKEANARVKAGGKVEITNSTFNDSQGMGVDINGGGNVSLASVTANNNGQFGANIQALGDVTIVNSFFSGNKSTNVVSCPGGGNGGDDDDKDSSKKDDDDKDSSGDRNKDDDHLWDAKYTSKSDDKDEDKDSSKKDDDDDKDKEKKDDDDDGGGGTTCNTGSTTSGYGLQVVTTGSIALDAVSASDNNLFGAHLEGTDVAISNSSFNNNGSGAGNEPVGKGLEIVASANSTGSGTGSVSLFNVEANNNQLFGANILATGSVAIGGLSFFSGNKSTNVVSCPGGGNGGDDDKDKEKKDDDDKDSSGDRNKDDDLLRDAKYTSKSDDKDGEEKDSSKKDDDDKDKEKKDDDDDDGGGTTCNTGTTSSGYGLQVVTTGFVSLDGVTASDNNLFGAHLEGANVAISNSSFNNNGSGTGTEPVGKGLEIISGSDVSLSNVEANNNQLFGANVQALGSVSISNSFFSGNKSTSIVSCPGGGGSGDDDKDKEKKDDDDKESSGDRNKDDDHLWDAKYTSKSDDKDDENKDSSKKDDDDDKDKEKKNDDDDDGDGGGTPCNTGTTSSGYGLQVVTTGPISLNAVTASDNNLFGAHLEGTDIAISNSSFNNNGSGTGTEPVGKGLEIISTGFVSLFNVEANNNQLFGANIQSTGDVIIGNSFFSGNKSTSIVSCPGGGGGGDDDKDKEKKDDDDKDSSENRNKDDDHLWDAKYTSKSDDKDDDDKDSSKKDDDDKDKEKKDDDDDDGDGGGGTPCNPGTTVTGYGLQVVTTGIISLDGVTASDNGVNGAILNSPAEITVTNSTFEGNGGTGLVITTTSGQVTLDNVTAANNGVDGVDVTGVCTTTVELIGGTYADNVEFGLRVTNATLVQSGSPVVFINNGLGAVFQDPGTCITSTPPATGSSTAGGQGLTSKVSSPKVADYPTYYRVSNNNLSLFGSFQAVKSNNLIASKTRPYKYTGGLLH